MMHRTGFAVILLLLALFSTACRRPLKIGAKNFPESELLAELIAQTVEGQTHIAVKRPPVTDDTIGCFNNLLSGTVDVYPEYSGTAYSALFQLGTNEHDPRTVVASVEKACQARKLRWIVNLGFENTFALYVRKEDAEKNHLKQISDLTTIAGASTVGYGFEFGHREDGFRRLSATYGLAFAAQKNMNLNDVYAALRAPRGRRSIDVGVGNSTDAEPVRHELVSLADGKNCFPPYEAGIMVRQETLDHFGPELEAALTSLSRSFSADEIRDANFQVQIRNRPVGQVAHQLLVRKHLIHDK